MLIGIASTRRPKVEAVRTVFLQLAPTLGVAAGDLKFTKAEVDSGVEETPVTLTRILEGARTRGKNLRERFRSEKISVTFCVGLEGGFFSVEDSDGIVQTFLQSWAYVINGDRESFGASGAIIVPQSIARPVLQDKESLAQVIDRTASQVDIRSKQGTWGVLSGDRVTRQSSFETALMNAMAPFYNPAMYGISSNPDQTR